AQDSNYRNISRYEMLAYENDSNCIVTYIKNEVEGGASINYVKIEDKITKKSEIVVRVIYDCPPCGKG
ncbi:MAG: hypothetical protein MUE53_03965, partial [Chitinophagales bacterium]|nr:hypothetical protein [Chitinophagales bacterium]